MFESESESQNGLGLKDESGYPYMLMLNTWVDPITAGSNNGPDLGLGLELDPKFGSGLWYPHVSISYSKIQERFQ